MVKAKAVMLVVAATFVGVLAGCLDGGDEQVACPIPGTFRAQGAPDDLRPRDGGGQPVALVAPGSRLTVHAEAVRCQVPPHAYAWIMSTSSWAPVVRNGDDWQPAMPETPPVLSPGPTTDLTAPDAVGWYQLWVTGLDESGSSLVDAKGLHPLTVWVQTRQEQAATVADEYRFEVPVVCCLLRGHVNVSTTPGAFPEDWRVRYWVPEQDITVWEGSAGARIHPLDIERKLGSTYAGPLSVDVWNEAWPEGLPNSAEAQVVMYMGPSELHLYDPPEGDA